MSFGLIRTNPKLTSNLKLTVDSAGSLWLNSIEANESLANQKYRRFAIGPDSNHETNVFRFYDNGKTPTSISFAIGSSIRTDVLARDLKDQYDFDLYSSGAKYLSAEYPEKFCYFAPLYLDAVIPEYFVIFKIPGASNYTAKEWYEKTQDPNFSQSKFARDLFQKAEVIKTISLKSDSKIGQYLRGIRQNPMYPNSPLYVNFKTGGSSLYRGVSIKSGTYVEIPELLDETFSKALAQLQLEKYVIGGFERNNVVHPKIINLEFLFDDSTSDEYSFNRYLGFYCNAIDLANFDIDLVKMYENDSDNDTPLSEVYSKYDELSLPLVNPNGIVIRGQGVQSDLSFIGQALTNEESLMFPYLKSKDNNLHFIKVGEITENEVGFSQIGTNLTFSVTDTSFDLGKTFGPDDLYSQETAQESLADTRTTVLLQLDTIPNHLDTVRIYHQNGNTFDSSDSTGKYDDLVFVKDYFAADETYSIDYFTADQIEFSVSTDPNSLSSTFSPEIQASSTDTIQMEESSIAFVVDSVDPFEVGDLVKVIYDETHYMIGEIESIDAGAVELTIGVTLLIGHGEYSNWIIQKHQLGIQYVSTIDGSLWQSNGQRFFPGAVGSRIYINADGTDTSVLASTVSKVINSLANTHLIANSYESSVFVQSRPFGNTYGSLAIRNLTASSAILINGSNTSNLVWADGGRLSNQVIIPAGNIQRLTPLLDSLVVKTYQNWSQIDRVCQSAVYVNSESTGITDQSSTNFLNYATLMIRDNERVRVDYDKIEIRKIFQPSIGLLSLFEIKDIDFGTYSSSYSRIPELDLYAYYFIPAETRILDFTKYVYKLTGSGSVKVNETVYTTGQEEVLIWQFIPGLHKYTILSGDPIVSQTAYKPGRLDDFNLIFKARTDTTIAFEETDSLLIDLSESDKTTLRNEFVSSFNTNDQFGTSSDSFDLSSITVDSIQTITTQTNLNFDPTDPTLIELPVITVFGNVENYFIGYITGYDSSTGDITLIVIGKEGSDTISDWSIYPSISSLYPTYRLYKSGEPFSYLEARLFAIEDTASSASPRAYLEIQNAVGQPITTDQWIIYGVEYTTENLRNDIAILDEDENLQSFTGFFGLGADHSAPNPNSVTYQDRDKYLTNSLRSEYSIYLENFSKEFATTNRVVPYITKWGIIDSTDSRGNPYRLNSDIAFGKDNFGPSHREFLPTAEKLTHEWFYIESKFNYELDENLVKKNHYYFDTPLDVNQLISDSTYFERYFTYTPTFNGIEVDRPQFRYSKLLRNQFTNQYETVFNGAKFVFSELNDVGEIIPNSNRFSDYNFSILLKPVKEDLKNPQSPVQYRMIENQDAKSILVLVEIALSGIDQVARPLILNTDDNLNGTKLDQSSLFSTGYLRGTEVKYPQIDVLYTTSNDSVGEVEFANLLVDGIVNDFTNLSGTAINAITGREIASFSFESGQTTLVTKYGTSEKILVAMPDSEIFNLVNTGQLQDICLDGTPGSTAAYKISSTKRIVVDGILYTIVKLTGALSTNTNNQLPIITAIPTWKSVFGDFRLSFSEDEISNLTYTFLYSVKDKKYNTTKSAFSTVKLAKGVSLNAGSLIEVNQTNLGEIYSLPAQDLSGLPTSAFSLNEFINPISGASEGYPAFSPLMFIDGRGRTKIVVSTGADLLRLTTDADRLAALANSRITNHAIRSVFPSSIELQNLKNISFISSSVTESTPSGLVPVDITAVDYADTATDVFIDFTNLELAKNYQIGDLITISNSGDGSPNFLLGKIIDINIESLFNRAAPGSGTAPSIGQVGQMQVSIYYQSSSTQPHPTRWFISRPSSMKTLGLALTLDGSNPIVQTIDGAYPSQESNSTWLSGNQQFQLFGGKDYYSNLFQNISFAKFINLLDAGSNLISWETYQGGELQLRESTLNRFFGIRVEAADQVVKRSTVKPIEQVVETGSRVQPGGYETVEQSSNEYEVFRYSGEYEILFKPLTGFKYKSTLGEFNLDGSNARLNTFVSDFFVMPEHSYMKYSNRNILDLESASRFSANYPLIGESPIDYDKFNVLSSSWDFNYHYLYTTKRDKTAIPGTRRLTEDYSFVSKLINLPLTLSIEPSLFTEVSNARFESSDTDFENSGLDFVYSNYPTAIRLRINLSKLIAKSLIDGGIGSQFNSFFKDSNDQTITTDPNLIEDLTLDQYKIKYCETNLVKLYQLAKLDFYSKPDYSLPDDFASLTQLTQAELESQGYTSINNVQINNPKSAIITCSIPKNSRSGISLVPKLKIEYI